MVLLRDEYEHTCRAAGIRSFYTSGLPSAWRRRISLVPLVQRKYQWKQRVGVQEVAEMT